MYNQNCLGDVSELCLTEYYSHEVVGNGDASPHILLPCVRERVPSTDIVEGGDIQNWRGCCRKEKTILLLLGTVPQYLVMHSTAQSS